MISDDNKTESFNLNNENAGSTESIELNIQAAKPTAGIDLNARATADAGSAGEHLIGAVINGCTVTSILSAATGEAEIFLAGRRGTCGDKVLSLQHETENRNSDKDKESRPSRHY
jgi:hypothetical protein